MTPADELARLAGKPIAGELDPVLTLLDLTVRCREGAVQVRDRCREVLSIVIDNHGEVEDLDEWRLLLPDWLVEAMGPERTAEESEAWNAVFDALPQPARVGGRFADVTGGNWTLSSWLYWFEPARRDWYWWDGVINDDHELVVWFAVRDWPCAWGALRWLLLVAGAESVEVPF